MHAGVGRKRVNGKGASGWQNGRAGWFSISSANQWCSLQVQARGRQARKGQERRHGQAVVPNGAACQMNVWSMAVSLCACVCVCVGTSLQRLLQQQQRRPAFQPGAVACLGGRVGQSTLSRSGTWWFRPPPETRHGRSRYPGSGTGCCHQAAAPQSSGDPPRLRWAAQRAPK